MNFAAKKRFKALLKARWSALQLEAFTNADSRHTVALDQTSVGRLSRMDAMQQQAMAKATQARRELEKQQVLAALHRLESDEFGYCDTCGDTIAEARLQISPTALKCISCVRG